MSQWSVSSLDWPLNPTGIATAPLLCRKAATSPHGHCVNVVIDSNRDRVLGLARYL